MTFAVEGDKISIGRIQEAFGNERAAEVQSLLAHAPTEVKAVWNKYADNIRFESTRHHGTAYYSSTDNQIRLNLEEDARKSVFHVPYQTTMHEIGHFFDFTAASEIYGTGSIPISRRYFSGAFSKTIREEAEAYTKKVHERLRAEAVAKGLKASSVSIKEVRAIISQELWNIGKVYGPVASGDLSDIFEGSYQRKNNRDRRAWFNLLDSS